MRRALLAVVVAMGLAIGVAWANLPEPSRVPNFRVCTLRADIVAQLLADGVRMRLTWYEGPAVARILAAFKAGTTQQEIAGDGILVATYPDIRDRLFLFQQGCFLAFGDRPPGWTARQVGS